MNFKEIIDYYKANGDGKGPGNIGLAAACRALKYSKMALYSWRDKGITLRTQDYVASKTGLPVRDADTKPSTRRARSVRRTA
jgi:hypothetical protein